jgi:hypothetical protein
MSAFHDCLFNVFTDTLHIWSPFFHPQPEDASCRGDKERLIMVVMMMMMMIIIIIMREKPKGF